MAEAKQAELVERVVVGKPFSCIDPVSGKRVSAAPGSKIKVRARTAAAHPTQLVAPSVAEAQKKAKEAEEAALQEVAKAEAAARAPQPAASGAVSKEGGSKES